MRPCEPWHITDNKRLLDRGEMVGAQNALPSREIEPRQYGSARRQRTT